MEAAAAESSELTFTGDIAIEAASAVGKPATFSALAYSGEPMQLKGFAYPVIVDLATFKASKQNLPVLKNHDENRIVGHTDSLTVGPEGITATGVVSGTGADASEVVENHKRGFTWQLSIGAQKFVREFLPPNKTAVVNGRTVTGPMIVARNTELSEISFVPSGADNNTSAAIAAKDSGMGTEQDLPSAEAIERDRLRGIRAAFEGQWGSLQAQGVSVDALYDRAVAEKWSVDRAELEVERASRPRPSGMSAHQPSIAANQIDVLQAALCQTVEMPNIEKAFDEKTLQAAHTAFHGRLGIQQLIEICACANGYVMNPGSRIAATNLGEMMRYAEQPAIRAQGFSTFSLTGILGATGNKAAEMGYLEADQTWREIAAIKNVKDFKAVTSYRLLDDLDYEELGPDGELKHGTISEESYDRRAKTYGKMFAITRTDMINDDLNMLDDLRIRLGLAAGIKISDVIWAAFMDNSSFFTTGHANYDEDTDTALATDGAALSLAEILFSKLKSPDGKIIGGDGAVLVVPPELAVKARMLYGTTNAGAVIDDNTIATAFRGLYRPVKQPRLSDSTYTGYSATAWYLLRNPRVAAVVAASFLNGRQTPIVEQAEADFKQLGIQMRGYHDFGADRTVDYVAGVQMAGVNV
jgi:phage head maturation protease